MEESAKLRAELAKANLQIRQTEEARQSRKARCVEKCNHPADFVCDYEDGTLHCLECLAEKWWQVEDILSGKHNVHTYWGALETIAYPERYLIKYDPVRVAKDALKEKRKCQSTTGIRSDVTCILDLGHVGFHSDGRQIAWGGK